MIAERRRSTPYGSIAIERSSSTAGRASGQPSGVRVGSSARRLGARAVAAGSCEPLGAFRTKLRGRRRLAPRRSMCSVHANAKAHTTRVSSREPHACCVLGPRRRSSAERFPAARRSAGGLGAVAAVTRHAPVAGRPRAASEVRGSCSPPSLRTRAAPSSVIFGKRHRFQPRSAPAVRRCAQIEVRPRHSPCWRTRDGAAAPNGPS